MNNDKSSDRKPIFLQPAEGRHYNMGRMSSVFKADGEETKGLYSISEWWLDPNSAGPGAHSHQEDDIFFVIEGTMSFLIGEKWVDAVKGSFVLVPGGIVHDFQNKTDKRAGALNISVPGNFEENMGAIVDWFKKHPVQDAK